MLKSLNASNITSQSDLLPPPGFKWRLLNGIISLTASATAGTRRVDCFQNFFNLGIGPLFVDTGSQTGINTTYYGYYLPTGTYSVVSSGTSTISSFAERLIFSEFDRISFNITLITGDVFTFYFLVEEVPA